MAAPRIQRLITWLPVGGIERRLVAILPRLRDAGFDIRLTCIREFGALADELRDSGVPVNLVPLKSRLHPKGIRQLAAQLKSERIELLHSHMYRSNVPGTIAARLAGLKRVYGQVHNVNTWESWRQRSMDRFLCRWRTGMIAVSEAVARDVRESLRLPKERVPIIYNGVDTSRFYADEDARARLREEFKAAPDETLIVVPARIHPNKNPLGVVKAWEEAVGNHSGQARLLFAGSGPMEEELKAAVEASSARDSIQLLGRRDDMAALYNASDLVLLSSFKEGFSNAVVEALATGKPLIAANVGGNKEAINSEEVGWIHEAGDHAALVAQLQVALSRGGKLAEMAPACRARAEVFSLDAMVRQTGELYESALRQ